MNRKLPFLIAATAIALTPACAEQRVAATDKAAIEKIVRAYILENPEIIEEALIALGEKQQAAEAARATEVVSANADALFKNASDNSIGPADAPVTVVEFFDYRCGFCKRASADTAKLPKKYPGKVRVVFKQLPILSAESEKAALAAVAAGNQGKFIEMHEALMELDNKSGFTPEEIDKTAKSVGVDVAKMRADMDSVEVQRHVADSKALARKMEINGTPNYVVGNQQIPGADMDALNLLIEAEIAALD